jgi:rhamnogalacturonan endolyase
MLRFVFALAPLFALSAAEPPERLGRGPVAVRSSQDSVFFSWRLLATDPAGVAFNVYRFTPPGPAVLLTPKPLTGPTHYIDTQADLTRDNYYIVHPVLNGEETGENPFTLLPANAPVRQYLSIPLVPPASDVTPDGAAYS